MATYARTYQPSDSNSIFLCVYDGVTLELSGSTLIARKLTFTESFDLNEYQLSYFQNGDPYTFLPHACAMYNRMAY